MPASQLSQLKAALSSAGLNRKSYSKKEKKAHKKNGAREADRAKSLQRLEDIRKVLNKFDEREVKTKFEVGGKGQKTLTGKPSISKQAGLEQRRKSLLPELELRGHTGTFRDRRFGESDPTMSLEDKMLERYTRERQRGQGKKGMFNLEDGEDLGLDDGEALGGLTHGGRSVMDLPGDDFDAQGFGEQDEEDKGRIDRRTVQQVHFGGFAQTGEGEEEEPERKKSKQEVMSEVIAKSKEHKYERQQQREMDAEIRDQLDDDIDDLRDLLQQGIAGPSTLRVRTTGQGQEPDTEGDYDQVVRTLAFDARAKPKNRTKTEDELALEEKERLEEAEAKRLRRMRGEPETDEEDDEPRKKRRTDRRGEADDLDDDFDEDALLGPGITREQIESMRMSPKRSSGEENHKDSDDEDTDEDRDEDADKETDDDEEEGVGMEDEDSELDDMADLDSDEAPELVPVDGVDGDDPLRQLVARSRVQRRADHNSAEAREIPYTFPCPANIDELEDILRSLDDAALPVVVQRIRSLHHPSLAQGNKEKLQDFLGVLLDYTLLLASRSQPAFQVIASVTPHIIALVKLNPLSAAPHFISKLSIMQKNLLRGLARGASSQESKTLPGAPELVLLRLIGTIWSTSDFSHPVVAPASLLIGQYLAQSRIRRAHDLASGLFLCSTLLQYEAVSKRLVPEAVTFIATALASLPPRKKDAAPVIAYPDIFAPDVKLRMDSSQQLSPQEPVDIAAALYGSNVEQTKTDLFAVGLRLTRALSGMLVSSEAFVEIFSPIDQILDSVRTARLSEKLRTLHIETVSVLKRQLNLARTTRQPVTMQSHKAIPIATFAPKFEDDFAPGKHYDPDAERNAAQKLKALYKKERKDAIRELRKDNKFLAGEKARAQADKDKQYNAKMRRVEGEINMERAEEKQMEREKKHEKRRMGRS